MAKKNGHDDGPGADEQGASNVAHFPGAREREEIERRLKVANDRAEAAAHEPMFNIPPMVKGLIVALVTVQLLMQGLEWMPGGEAAGGWPDQIIMNFGFFVLRYFPGEAMPFGWQGILSPVTYMFLHGGWLHLCVNLLTLTAFGSGLEKEIGAKKMGLLLLLTGVIAAFTHVAVFYGFVVTGNAGSFPYPGAPLVGASGGTCGLIGGVLMMARQRGLIGTGYKMLPIVAVVLLSMVFLNWMPGVSSPIAWTAHVGGFMAGLLLYRPVVKLKL